jgi:hypothetical protein
MLQADGMMEAEVNISFSGRKDAARSHSNG